MNKVFTNKYNNEIDWIASINYVDVYLKSYLLKSHLIYLIIRKKIDYSQAESRYNLFGKIKLFKINLQISCVIDKKIPFTLVFIRSFKNDKENIVDSRCIFLKKEKINNFELIIYNNFEKIIPYNPTYSGIINYLTETSAIYENDFNEYKKLENILFPL